MTRSSPAVCGPRPPSSCLAVRRGKAFRRSQVDEPLVACQICGKSDASTLCSPTLVGGEIIGSVLIRSGRDSISDRATADVQQTVASAAPVLANLRNLAVAETRAVTDSLTGLANSRAATETLSVMAAYAARSGQPLSAILADLDHFKQVNDNYGHPIGDEVLAAAAESFRNSVRSSDFVARYGGEEFLVLLQGTDKQSAAEVAEKMRRALAYLRVPGFAARATASFGIATIPDDAAEPDGLLRAADEALYSSKENGRDRVTVYREPAESDPRAAAKSR
jgi:diguanylate cyclase (GGDEF)-like protein